MNTRPIVILIAILLASPGVLAGVPVIDDAHARAITVANIPGPDSLMIDDVMSRAITVRNLPIDPELELDIGDAVSRTFTVANIEPGGPQLMIDEAHSRAFTVFNDLSAFAPLVIDDVASRAFTVLNIEPDPPQLLIDDAHSRAFTVLNCVACAQDNETCEIGPDCDGSGLNDICEALVGLDPDCNFNLTPDSCDIASLFSPDCNVNGVPDECDADCSGSGLPDDCDVGPCATCLGDVNGDDRVNGEDLHAFAAILLTGGTSDCGDIDFSGGPLTIDDLEPFVCRVLSAGDTCLP